MQCAVNGDSSQRHILEIAMTANAAARGETSNAGSVTFEIGEGEKTVEDLRCGAGRLAVLVPLDAEAAAAGWWLKKMGAGEMTLCAGNDTKQRKFGYLVAGNAKA